MQMTDDQLEALKKAALAATPQNLDSAEIINREPGLVDCPTCGGDGYAQFHADFCNYDGHALGVQFYGIGPEHLAAEAYFRAASPATILALIERVERAEAASTLSYEKRKRIAQIVHTDCTLIPGATFYNAAELAIEATLAAIAASEPNKEPT